jgi:hypothetical protein
LEQDEHEIKDGVGGDHRHGTVDDEFMRALDAYSQQEDGNRHTADERGERIEEPGDGSQRIARRGIAGNDWKAEGDPYSHSHQT